MTELQYKVDPRSIAWASDRALPIEDLQDALAQMQPDVKAVVFLPRTRELPPIAVPIVRVDIAQRPGEPPSHAVIHVAFPPAELFPELQND